MADFANDPAFVALHPDPIPFHFTPIDGSTVHFKDASGQDASGYFVPAKSGVKSAVIMVHEWYGLNDYIKKNAEDLHEKTGYAVLAVDLYEGKVASNSQDASKYIQSVNSVRAGAVSKGAVLALKSGALGIKASKIGTIGYCFGGGWSYNTAAAGGADVQACVIYYGTPDTKTYPVTTMKAPILFVFGLQDQRINDKYVRDFAASAKAANKSIEVRPYDAGHGFANPSNPSHNAAAATDARKHELAFFKKYLG